MTKDQIYKIGDARYIRLIQSHNPAFNAPEKTQRSDKIQDTLSKYDEYFAKIAEEIAAMYNLLQNKGPKKDYINLNS